MNRKVSVCRERRSCGNCLRRVSRLSRVSLTVLIRGRFLAIRLQLQHGLTSPLAGLDKDVLAGVFAHDFGLPGEAELQKLLVSHVPSGSSIPGSVDAGSIPAVPSSVAAQELTAESLVDSEKSVEAGISPQVFEDRIAETVRCQYSGYRKYSE